MKSYSRLISFELRKSAKTKRIQVSEVIREFYTQTRVNRTW